MTQPDTNSENIRKRQFSTSEFRGVDNYSDFILKKTGAQFYATIRRKKDMKRVAIKMSVEEAIELRDWLERALVNYV